MAVKASRIERMDRASWNTSGCIHVRRFIYPGSNFYYLALGRIEYTTTHPSGEDKQVSVVVRALTWGNA
jgi:hypothetical protein